MPLRGMSAMEQRRAFVTRASEPGANVRDLCEEAGIARSTGYRLMERMRTEGVEGLLDRSRRPLTSPSRTAPELEERVIAARLAHPTWGGRKLHAWLQRQTADPAASLPAPSTITEILRRHDLLTGPRVGRPRANQRFEYAAPNQLWQIDFVGHLALTDRRRVHPLTIIDDHSRFLIGLHACANEQVATVKTQLSASFRHVGLPDRILADNGPSWASGRRGGLNRLEAWLLRLDVVLIHGRPRHPQTQGKVERGNQTIGNDVFRQYGPFPDLAQTQLALDRFRAEYNDERPHEALNLAVPADRYRPSSRPFPEVLPPLTYPATDVVRRVAAHGGITFRDTWYFVSEGIVGEEVGIRPTEIDGVFAIYYANRYLRVIDVRSA